MTKLPTNYCIASDKPAGRELVRVIVEQLAYADSQLADSDVSRVDAVHKARRCIKRTRAALHLVSARNPSMQNELDAVLRDLGRSLSAFRDHDVAHDALGKILGENESADSNKRIRACVDALDARRALDARQQSRYLSATVAAFSVAVTVLNEKLAGTDIGDLQASELSEAAKATVAKARDARDAAAGSDDLDLFHDLRKLTQRALNQARLIADIDDQWSALSEDGLVQLAAVLGRLQDLVVVDLLVSDERLDPRLSKGASSLRKIVRKEQKRLRKRVTEVARMLDNMT